jgi:Putative beta barrel porin-7 (BBP7)
MSKGLLAAIAVLFAGAGAALAQTPAAPPVVVGPPAAGTPVASGAVMTTPPIDGPGFNGGAYSGGYVGGYGGSGCGLANCATDCGCPWYGRAEYLLWWTKDMPNSTPLATSVAPNTPTGGTPIPGAVGGAGTTVIMGGNDVDLGVRQGGRFTLGRWFDPQQTVAFEGNYFFLGSASNSQSAIGLGGSAASTLMLPFFDVTGALTGGTPGQSALLPALAHIFNVPGGLNGPFITHDNLYDQSELQGASGYGVFNVTKSGRFRFDTLFGFRWLNLDEKQDFTTTNETVNSAPQHVIFNASDSFETSNNFYGALLGLRAEYAPDDGSGGWRGGFCYRGSFLLGLGDTAERINISGASQTNIGTNNTLVNYPGGVFAQPSNMGNYDANHFAVVPEGDFSVGYAFCSWARVLIGYDILYISDVARPGSQIDSGVNVYRSGVVQAAQPPITAPGTDPNRPGYSGAQSSFWAQGLTLGVELHF